MSDMVLDISLYVRPIEASSSEVWCAIYSEMTHIFMELLEDEWTKLLGYNNLSPSSFMSSKYTILVGGKVIPFMEEKLHLA